MKRCYVPFTATTAEDLGTGNGSKDSAKLTYSAHV
jgi:hypothetical protein